MPFNGILNENITAQATPGSTVDWSGGEGVCIMEGTWNGATITLQMRSNSDGAWVGMGSNAALTADGVFSFVAPQGAQLRALASVADPTGVEVSIMKLGGAARQM
jgi:hypothetical protein